MSSTASVTVIVTTKNSARTLAKCLQSIKQQSYKNIELVVVDNFSTDDTPAIAKQYADKFYQKGPERCTQRNFGAAQSTGYYVVFIDSDMYLSPRVIADCLQAIQAAGVAGVVIPEESIGEGFWARCKQLERSFYVGVPYMEAARFFRTSTFIEAGRYDEGLVSGEDWDLSQRVAKLGSLVHVKAVIHHDEGRISLLKTINKKYYYSKSFAAYSRKHAGSLHHRRQTNPFVRFWLFFKHPVKLASRPVTTIGMLFMKASEFLVGEIGLIASKLSD